ncbi:intradiol ring-cleavage dioxygenase [soil metagenome]
MDQDHTNPEINNKQKKFSRRKALSILGATAATSMVSISGASAISDLSTYNFTNLISGTPNPACIVRPQQIEGPYFVDERLLRQDIRKDLSDNSIKEGVELQLVFNVSQITGNDCKPLPDALVDLWQCDAEGIYAGVEDRSFDTRGKKFLRGYQVTDSNGSARFVTIFPGWYRGRATHIHFKIRTAEKSQNKYEFTSQIYFNDSLNRQIYSQAPYASQESGYMENEKDSIYRNGGEQLKLPLTKNKNGYQGNFDIGLQIS